MRYYTQRVQLCDRYTEDLHKYHLLLLKVLSLLGDLEPQTAHPVKTDLMQALIP